MRQELKFDFQINLKKGHRGTVISKQKQSEPHLRILLAAAHQIRQMMGAEKLNSYKVVAVKLNLSPARVSQIMDLLFLAPKIQEDILCGENDRGNRLSEKVIREVATKNMEWDLQNRKWGDLISVR